MDKIKIHIYGLPHTLTIRDHPQMMTCAYTTKIWLLCEKLAQEGHEVIHYGVEIPDHLKQYSVPGIEYVSCIPYKLWEETHGKRDANKTFHEHKVNMPTYQLAMKTFPEKIIEGIIDPSREVVLASFGFWSSTLLEISKKIALIEFGIGYDAVFTQYKVFESHSWMHTVYGIKDTHLKAPGWFDAVIPGYVKAEEFEFKAEKEDYLLCLGRMIDTKGIHVAAQLAKEKNIKLILAGNGDTSWVKDFPNVEYVGVVGIEEKKKLLSNAKATMCNTHYVEPFGNVHIESLMSGTPVITTDWGVYTETVPHGEVGFRGRTWNDFLYAFDNLDKINPKKCREWAMANFSMDAVYPKFNAFFEKCAKHFTAQKGWYFDYDEIDYFVNYRQNYLEYTKTHLMLIVNSPYFAKAKLAINSFASRHENFDLTIINVGLEKEESAYFAKLPFFNKEIISDKNVYWAKGICASNIATSGTLLILDADTITNDNLEEFLEFKDNNIWLNTTPDYATFQQQNDFNVRERGSQTYFNAQFTSIFEKCWEYRNEMTINAGLLAFNLNNVKARNFLNNWSTLCTELEPKINIWPNEQGALNHMLYSDKLISSIQMFSTNVYNRTILETEVNDLQVWNSAKLVHYHNFLPKELKNENSNS